MSKQPLTFSDEAKGQMPMITVASLIALVAIGTWAYLGLHETLNAHSTKIELKKENQSQKFKSSLIRDLLYKDNIIKSHLIGEFQFKNIMLAICIGD